MDTTIGEYRPLSKAKKLRLLWRNESDGKVGKLILDLCEHAEAMFYTHGRLDDEKRGAISDLKVEGQKLIGLEIALEFPVVKEDTLESLLKDIQGGYGLFTAPTNQQPIIPQQIA